MKINPLNEIQVKWHKPIKLSYVKDGYEKRLDKHNNKRVLYVCDPSELERIPQRPGIYCFARNHGESISPIYIGQADKLRTRIDQHLRDMNKMLDIKDAKKGSRVLLFGELTLQPRQRPASILPILEKSLIDHALSEGYEIINKKSTKPIPKYRITSKGPRRTYYKPFPDQMHVASRGNATFALPSPQKTKITIKGDLTEDSSDS